MADKSELLKNLKNEKVSIPDWPRGAVMKIKLGRRSFVIPVKNKQNLLEFKKCKAYVTCQINGQGEVEFHLNSGIPAITAWLTLGTVVSAFSAFFYFVSPDLWSQLAGTIWCGTLAGMFAMGGAYLLFESRESHLTDKELANLRALVLFNQFRDEITKEVEKCVFLKKEKQDSVIESLEQAELEKEATFLGIQRLRNDLTKEETGMEIQPTNPFSEDGGSTGVQSSVSQGQKTELEN